MSQVKVRLSKFCWLCLLLDVSYSVIAAILDTMF